MSCGSAAHPMPAITASLTRVLRMRRSGAQRLAGRLQTFNWEHLDLDDVYISEERLKAPLEAFPASEFS